MGGIDIALLTGRDLDAAVAEYLLGWTEAHVGKDYNGMNESDVLAPMGKIDYRISLPTIGKIHRAFLVPQFSSRLDLAMQLAKQFGQAKIEITADLRDIPAMICRALLYEHAARAAEQGPNQ